MENIDFKVTEQDIKNYVIEHKNDEKIRNKEAMFVKYMKENKTITQESLEILMKKYNLDERVIHGTYRYDNHGILKRESLSSFENYLEGIQNLDISGICHILIPTLGYYGKKEIGAPYVELEDIVEKMYEEVPTKSSSNCLESAIDNYDTIGKISKISQSHSFNIVTCINIRMSKETCRRELAEYSSIYGEEPVKQIRKIIRERV